ETTHFDSGLFLHFSALSWIEPSLLIIQYFVYLIFCPAIHAHEAASEENFNYNKCPIVHFQFGPSLITFWFICLNKKAPSAKWAFQIDGKSKINQSREYQ